MPDQKTIDLIGQEVHTPNHVRKYEQEKKAKELEATAQSVRNDGLELSKETQVRMVEYIKTNSKATLLDIIRKFYRK
tara:strand:- start:242 stop:472 length:231 start_codon:yes stop_codon:yes gene_type:complete